jgi:hypothetical protein
MTRAAYHVLCQVGFQGSSTRSVAYLAGMGRKRARRILHQLGDEGYVSHRSTTEPFMVIGSEIISDERRWYLTAKGDRLRDEYPDRFDRPIVRKVVAVALLILALALLAWLVR